MPPNRMNDYMVLMLNSHCWYGFRIRYWWNRVLWQAVTLWLVNRGVAVRRGWPVERVCNREETTWYENHTVRFRQSVQSESRVEPEIRRRSEVQALAPPGFRKKIWGKKKSPLWVYVSPSISQNYIKLCASFEDKMSEKYFYKEVCLVRSLKFVHFLWLMFLVGSMRSIQY